MSVLVVSPASIVHLSLDQITSVEHKSKYETLSPPESARDQISEGCC